MIQLNEQTSDEQSIECNRTWSCAEVVFIFLICFLYAGSPAPDVNEAHYLGKAKHYWNPGWCPDDHFLNSPDAHVVLNWTFGWLTLLLPLSAVAWIGRVLTWSLFAWGWQRLSSFLVPTKLMSILSAALFLSVLQHCHLAGEWVIGGVEGKGFAYAFVFVALAELSRDRWRLVWLLLGVATAFHALVGGWSMVSAALIWLTRRKQRSSITAMLPALIGGVLLALPALVAGLALNWNTDAQTVREANQIYVFERLSHHLAPHTFEPTAIKLPELLAGSWELYLLLPSQHILRFLALLIVWLVLWCFVRDDPRQKPVQNFVAAAVIIAALGAAIDLYSVFEPVTGAALLRYYWFRLSDAMVPMGTSLAVVGILVRCQRSYLIQTQWCIVVLVLLVWINFGSTVSSRFRDPRAGADRQAMPRYVNNEELAGRQYQDWRRVCQWISEHTPSDSRMLTPLNQQTFKWYADRSEVVSWKDIPQDAEGLVEWKQRFQDVFPSPVRRFGLVAQGDQRLVKLARKYRADYIVVDRTRYRRRLSFPRVYPNLGQKNSSYEVYRLSTRGSN